jgi:aminomethyltransferase
MIERGIPRHDYPIADLAGNIVGKVTSGTNSPSTGLNIGMGYVPVALSSEGSEFAVVIRDKHIKAKVVKLPFYKK